MDGKVQEEVSGTSYGAIPTNSGAKHYAKTSENNDTLFWITRDSNGKKTDSTVVVKLRKNGALYKNKSYNKNKVERFKIDN